MRRGRALERLITGIEKSLASDPNVKVESPKRLRDRTNGSLREHDVVLSITRGHHSLRIAIECRDLSRPVTVNQVEGFWAKCQHTGIDQGLMVSPRGFCKTALAKASHLGIRCLELDQAESFEWLKTAGITLVRVTISHADWNFHVSDANYQVPAQFAVTDPAGNTITLATLTLQAQRELSKHLPFLEVPIDNAEASIPFPGAGLLARDVLSGATAPIAFAIAHVRYSVHHELIPFKLVQYSEKSSPIADAACADLQIGGQSAQVIISHTAEGGRIAIVHDGIPSDR